MLRAEKVSYLKRNLSFHLCQTFTLTHPPESSIILDVGVNGQALGLSIQFHSNHECSSLFPVVLLKTQVICAHWGEGKTIM